MTLTRKNVNTIFVCDYRSTAYLTCVALYLLIAPAVWGQCSWQLISTNPCMTGGNVGIGTASPGSSLDIIRNGSGISIDAGDGATVFGGMAFNREAINGAIFRPASSAYQFTNYGNHLELEVYNGDGSQVTPYAMAVTSAGNVGIGTGAPRHAGFVSSGWLESGGMFINNNANVGGTSFASTSLWPPNGGILAWNKTGGAGEVDLINLSGTGSDGGFGFYDRDNQLMRVTRGGQTTIGWSFAGSANSGTFTTNAGPLPTAPASDMTLASIGYISDRNEVHLGVHARRTNTTYSSTGWTTTAIGLGMDVDNSPFANQTGIWLASNGRVGIGTATPLHTFSVIGSIGAGEVVVAANGGADYVFEPEYRLAGLSEVSDYIKANHHLPGIASAKETGETGLSLGEMQTKLLAKIEELTLHMIHAEQDRKSLQDENRQLGIRVAQLEREKVSK